MIRLITLFVMAAALLSVDLWSHLSDRGGLPHLGLAAFAILLLCLNLKGLHRRERLTARDLSGFW